MTDSETKVIRSPAIEARERNGLQQSQFAALLEMSLGPRRTGKGPPRAKWRSAHIACQVLRHRPQHSITFGAVEEICYVVAEFIALALRQVFHA